MAFETMATTIEGDRLFLTVGIEDNAETFLSYDHFEHSRLWTEKHNLDHLPKDDQQKARWSLADVYSDALLRVVLYILKIPAKERLATQTDISLAVSAHRTSVRSAY